MPGLEDPKLRPWACPTREKTEDDEPGVEPGWESMRAEVVRGVGCSVEAEKNGVAWDDNLQGRADDREQGGETAYLVAQESAPGRGQARRSAANLEASGATPWQRGPGVFC
jgi:hypothetical protein